MKYSFLLLFVLSMSVSCSAQKESDVKASCAVMFYNLENLYDTINDPLKDDESFLPDAERNWNTEKYNAKIEHLSKVIATGAEMMPALIGVCEIENINVVRDLAASAYLKDENFDVIHFDSPDERGIDVALMYNTTKFNPKQSFPIHVTLPGETVDYTRDILCVKGELLLGGNKETLYIFVNHWPSRVEGEEISAPKRAAAAQALKHVIDSLNNKLTNPNILIMGDFNDTPFDVSIQTILGAKELTAKRNDETLVDLMTEKQKSGEGSYSYKGNWQCLDQIIVSTNLLNNKLLDVDENSVQIVKQDWMLYHSDKYGDSPNRTYAGTKYVAGYSDHLPVVVHLTMH